MKIEYRETSDDLMKRIDIHSRYGSRDIDQWMLELLAPQKGIKILDVGCGAGKLCFSFYKHLDGDCEIVGGDVSLELLEKAEKENQKRDAGIRFMELDFNKPFPFEDDTFDLLSCSFAIYYAENIPFTISEMKRVLKPGGKLFTTGPMPQNKQKFYEIIRKATGQTIPPMPGSSRYESEIYSEVQKQFPKADLIIFENPLVFDTAEPFLTYTGASLSEDRKLWKNLFQGEAGFDVVMEKIASVTEDEIKQHGSITMTKVVGGIVAVK
jgi:ubiquinone/menaquinone biosynthesis C-methylase UbiE